RVGRYLPRRLAQGGRVIFGVTVFVFIITRVIGDPVKFMLPLSATEQDREERREALGLNDPLYQQFWHFLKDVVRGDFGESTYVRGRPALDVVMDFLPRTLQLVGVGMLIAVVLSIPLGVIASRKPGGTTDRLLTTLS